MAQQMVDAFKDEFNRALDEIQKEDPNPQMPKGGLGVVTFLVSQKQHKLTVVTVNKRNRPYREITLVSHPLDDTLKKLFPGTTQTGHTGLRAREVPLFVYTKDSVWVMPTRIGINNEGPLATLSEPQLSPIDGSTWQSVHKTAGYSQVYHTPITFVMGHISNLAPDQFERWVIYPLVAAVTLLHRYKKAHNNICLDNVRCVLTPSSLKVMLAGFEVCTDLDTYSENTDYTSLMAMFAVFASTRSPHTYMYQTLEKETIGCLWNTYHDHYATRPTAFQYMPITLTHDVEFELNGVKEQTLIMVGGQDIAGDLTAGDLFEDSWHKEESPEKRPRRSGSPMPIGGNGGPGTPITTSSVHPLDPAAYKVPDLDVFKIPDLDDFDDD